MSTITALAEPAQEPATLPGPGLVMCPACCAQFDPSLNRVQEHAPPVRRADGMPTSAEERHLRRLLALRAAMPHTYYDDGEAQGIEHGISIDFMREPVAHIDAKLRALNVARAIAKRAEQQEPVQQALVEADRIMGHDDEATEWRERWGHLFEGLPQRPAEQQEPDRPERRCGGPGGDGTCCQPVQEPVAWRFRASPSAFWRVTDDAELIHAMRERWEVRPLVER